MTKSFSRLVAVAGVDFEVQPGELRSIIGPNGAGKSTFFKLISGELAPSTGRVIFDGEDITGLRQFAASQRGIAKSYPVTTIFPGLSVFENVRIAAQCRRTVLDCWTPAERVQGVAEAAREILRLVELDARRMRHHQERSAASRPLSSAMSKRAAAARSSYSGSSGSSDFRRTIPMSYRSACSSA